MYKRTTITLEVKEYLYTLWEPLNFSSYRGCFFVVCINSLVDFLRQGIAMECPYLKRVQLRNGPHLSCSYVICSALTSF